MSDKLSPLAGVSATREVLEAHGLATKKALGQNFLINDGILKRICALSEVNRSDDVVEVGPGIGTLTLALLKNAGRVVSIERDTDLPVVLAQTCADYASSFTLISGDALDMQPDDLPFSPNKFIANLPYAVAATLVLDYFERFESLESATVMVQAEVADRMAAVRGTKNYGAYTIKLGLFACPAGRFTVSPGNFFPPPRVNSAVLRLNRVTHSDIDDTQRAGAAIMADAAFATRRKTIANSCKTYFSASATPEVVDCLAAIFSEADIDPKLRGEALDLDDFKRLGRAYVSVCKHLIDR